MFDFENFFESHDSTIRVANENIDDAEFNHAMLEDYYYALLKPLQDAAWALEELHDCASRMYPYVRDEYNFADEWNAAG
jgi:hypothetical protein